MKPPLFRSCMDRLLELTSRAERTHFWFRGFRAFVQPLVRQALSGVSTPRILDCGCGTGANIEMLRAHGVVHGFDLTLSGLQRAIQLGRGPVVRASIDAIPYQDQRFDLVTSFDVLYSLPDAVERAAVRELWRVLKPGGHALINVAALEMLRGPHSALSAEVRRYSPRSLRTLFEDAGFEVRRVSFVFASVFPLTLAVRLAQRVMGSGDAPGEFDITVPAAPINAALTALVRAEALALRITNMPIGSSVLCLAQKPDHS
jgi:SAM-dependent methyltransferase